MRLVAPQVAAQASANALVVRRVTIICVLVIVIFVANQALFGNNEFTALLLTTVLTNIVALLLLRNLIRLLRTGTHSMAALHMQVLNFLLVYFVITLKTGGIRSPALVWFSIVNIISECIGIFSALRHLWTAIQLCGLSLMLYFEFVGYLPLEQVELPPLFIYIVNGALVLYIDLAVGAISSSLMKKIQNVYDAGVLKSQYFSHLSHEMRTPLTTIMGWIDMYKHSVTVKSREEKQMMNAVEMACQRLLARVVDVLDITSVEENEIILFKEPFLMQRLFDAMQEMVQLLLKPGVEYELKTHMEHSNDVVVGDYSRLYQVVYTLLSNAAAFTKRGKITLVCRELDAPSSMAVHYQFQVSDTGIGMTKHVREQLFNALELNTGGAVRRGTGASLSVAKKIIEQMGGTIGVTSSVNKGSSFSFDVVLSLAREGVFTDLYPNSNSSADSGDMSSVSDDRPFILGGELEGENVRILLVEDNKLNQLMLKKMLKSFECKVDVADDGCEAVSACEARVYNFIVMDYIMPRMSGLEALERIRGSGSLNSGTPIIILSASSDVRSKLLIMSAGADLFLPKPVTQSQLMTALKELSRRES